MGNSRRMVAKGQKKSGAWCGVIEMQSEAGARRGARFAAGRRVDDDVHRLAGLLLKLPNMFKIAAS